MKKLIAVILFVLLCVFSFAQEGYRIIESYQIGPGCHYTWYGNADLPMQIYVTTMDMTNPYLTIECTTSNDKLRGYEGTSTASKRTSYASHQAVCGVNGDYYDTSNGVPLSPTLINGEFTHTPFIYRNGFGFTKDRKGTIFNPVISSVIISQDGEASYTLANVNLDRAENEICMYNDYFGSSTATRGDGAECLINAISDWVVNDTVYCVVESCDSVSNDRSIPENKSVLSGIGAGASFLRTYCQIDDTIKIVQTFPKDLNQITQFMGGACKMMADGVNVAEESGTAEFVWSTYLTGRNPRTVIGFDGDSTLIYFIVVDGRQTDFSIGVGMDELVEFMSAIGVKNAVNLDGGGSSTMVVRHSVENSPSDGWERRVANSVLCFSSAPDTTLSIIQFKRHAISLYKGQTAELPLSGWDMFYNPQEITEDAGLRIDHPEGLGTYEQNGLFTASKIDMDGCLYASLGESSDSVNVHIISIDSLTVYPKYVVSDTLRPVQFHIYGREDGGIYQELDPAIFDLELIEGDNMSVDQNGSLIAHEAGTAKLVVHYGDVSDTVEINIETGMGEVLLNELESLSDWTLKGSNLDTNVTKVELIDRNAGDGTHALRIDYTTIGDGTIILETDPIRIYGVPSAFLIDALSDGLRHRLYLVFDDTNGNEYRFKASGYFNDDEEFVTKTISSEAIIPGDGNEYYPMYLKQIYINLADGIESGSLYFDRIRCVYPSWTGIDPESTNTVPSSYTLHQNYPNPFNPVTTIQFELPEASDVTLNIFDTTGKVIATLVQGNRPAGSYSVDFNAALFPTGLYFYRLNAGDWSEVRKMVMIK